MTMSREQTVAGVLEEWSRCADFIDGLTDEQWHTTSRCEGWEVRDVAGHLVGLVVDVFASGIAAPRTSAEQAAEWRDRSPAELAEALRKAVATADPLLHALDDNGWATPSPVPDLSIGEGVMVLWYDAFVHRDDIAVAIGAPPDRGPSLAAMVDYVKNTAIAQGWSPAGVDVDGIDPYEFV